jgi:hypothetical protein
MFDAPEMQYQQPITLLLPATNRPRLNQTSPAPCHHISLLNVFPVRIPGPLHNGKTHSLGNDGRTRAWSDLVVCEFSCHYLGLVTEVGINQAALLLFCWAACRTGAK